jgi:hypothetical protein
MTKRFAIGFGIGLFLFITINLISAHFSSDCGLPTVFGRDSRAGWPLLFYEDGGFAYQHSFNSVLLLLDLGVGMIFSLAFGWLFSRNKKLFPNKLFVL